MDTNLNMYSCKTCLGEYAEKCYDGLLYFHACPPLIAEDGTITERADKRDENIGKKLAGKGVTKLS